MNGFGLNVGARHALRPSWARARLAAVLIAVLLAAGATSAGAMANAGAFVESLGQQVLTVLKKTEDAGARRAELAGIFDRAFEVDTLAKLALGRHWPRATSAQQQEYLDLFRSYVVAFYASTFANYSGELFSIESVRPLSAEESFVAAELSQRDGRATRLLFRIHQSPVGPSIVDVAVDGVSLVSVKRAEFDSVVRQNGLDGLLTRLREVTTSLGGAPPRSARAG